MAVDLVPLPRARDLATRKMVKYALVATALVPVFGDSETSKSSEFPKDPKNGDDVEPPKEVVETVDANWGEGLEEIGSLYFRGSRMKYVRTRKRFLKVRMMNMNPQLLGMKS